MSRSISYKKCLINNSVQVVVNIYMKNALKNGFYQDYCNLEKMQTLTLQSYNARFVNFSIKWHCNMVLNILLKTHVIKEWIM